MKDEIRDIRQMKESLREHFKKLSALLMYRNSGIILLCTRKGVKTMPTIKSSADLRNHYNDISEFCHTYAEPVFITKNGKGDLAVMSIEVYEQMMGRLELYNKLQAGLEDVREGRTVPAEDVMSEIRKRRQR